MNCSTKSCIIPCAYPQELLLMHVIQSRQLHRGPFQSPSLIIPSPGLKSNNSCSTWRNLSFLTSSDHSTVPFPLSFPSISNLCSIFQCLSDSKLLPFPFLCSKLSSAAISRPVRYLSPDVPLILTLPFEKQSFLHKTHLSSSDQHLYPELRCSA